MERVDLLTIAPGQEVHAELEVKRSRFLAVLRRTESEAEARALVAEQRRTRRDARHHCSASVLQGGDAGLISRSSDDGEPTGTAGKPMLAVVQGAGLVNVCVVVTRYFGGTLLGAGGLVRAYSGAVALVVAQAPTVGRQRLELMDLRVEHATAGRVEAELRAGGVMVLDVRYLDQAVLTLAMPGPGGDLVELVAATTSGSGRLAPVGYRWVDV